MAALRPAFPVASVALALALGCGGTPPPATTTPTATDTSTAVPENQGMRRPPTANERFTLEKLFRDTERVRGLAFQQPVPVEIHDRKAIESYVSEQVKKDEVTKQKLMYVALGLLDNSTDIQALLVRVMGEQIVGYYDDEKHIFVVRDDIISALPKNDASVTEARMIIVHEMVHALQDQHLNLGERFNKESPTDQGNAYHALVEGDATLAMIGYVIGQMGAELTTLTQNPTMLSTVLEQTGSMSSSPELEHAPAILRVTLIASYFDGLKLCAFAHGKGGWGEVDALHDVLPTSTEQVMHPDKYAAHDAPVSIDIPKFPGLESAGYAPTLDDTLGELEMGVYFGQKVDDVDPVAADGWGGDRLRVYRRPDGAGAIVWWTAWDTDKDAKEAEAAARRVAGKADLVRRAGKALLMTRNVDAEFGDELATAFSTWASTRR